MIAGATSGTRPAHVARAALEAIAWRVADVLVAVRQSVRVDVLRVDGGLTRSKLLLSMQADAAGVAVQPGAVDATAAGAAALAAVGAGIWRSTLEIGERIPGGTGSSPSATTRGASASTPPGGSSSSAPRSSEAGPHLAAPHAPQCPAQRRQGPGAMAQLAQRADRLAPERVEQGRQGEKYLGRGQSIAIGLVRR